MAGILYDVHTHIGLDPGFYLRRWWPYAATVPELLAAMDAHGIDRAVCFPFTCRRHSTRTRSPTARRSS